MASILADGYECGYATDLCFKPIRLVAIQKINKHRNNLCTSLSYTFCEWHKSICVLNGNICVNSIEYIKLKTHGKMTRMDSNGFFFIKVVNFISRSLALSLLLFWCANLYSTNMNSEWSPFRCVHNMISFWCVSVGIGACVHLCICAKLFRVGFIFIFGLSSLVCGFIYFL